MGTGTGKSRCIPGKESLGLLGSFTQATYYEAVRYSSRQKPKDIKVCFCVDYVSYMENHLKRTDEYKRTQNKLNVKP